MSCRRCSMSGSLKLCVMPKMNIMIWILYLCGSFMATCIISETVEWRIYSEFRYWISENKATFDSAVQHCTDVLDAELAVPHDYDYEEKRFLGTLLLDIESAKNEANPIAWLDNCVVIDKRGDSFSVPCNDSMENHYICRKLEWREYDHHLYFLSKEKRTWNGSSERCEVLDSTLVAILSEGENSFLRSAMYNLEQEYFWTGYVQGDLECDCLYSFPITCMECRQSWRWYDGSEVTYMNWATESPTRPDYACSVLFHWEGDVWFDWQCDDEFPFVCKKTIRFNTCEDNLCAAGSTCEPVPDDTYRCICPDGNEGRHCDVPINECASSPCQNDGNCKDRVNGFECYCPQRYTGVFCERDTEFNATTTTMPFTITVEHSSPLIQFQSQSTTLLPAAQSTVEKKQGQQADSDENPKENGLNRNAILYIVTGGIVLLLLVIATLVIAITNRLKYRKLGQRENEIITQYESILSAMSGSRNAENTPYQYIVHPDYLKPVAQPQQQRMSSSNSATYQDIA